MTNPSAIRVLCAPINPRERFGVERHAHLLPCAPAAWREVVILDEDVTNGRVDMDTIPPGEEPCMWRSVDATGTWRSHAFIEGKAVDLPVLPGLGTDPLGDWEGATMPEAMLHGIEHLVPSSLVVFSCIALARVALATTALDHAYVGARSLQAVVAAEAAMRRSLPLLNDTDLECIERETLLDASRGGFALWAALATLHAARNAIVDDEAGLYEAAMSTARCTSIVCDRAGAPQLAADAIRGVIPTQAVYEALVRRVSL